MIKNLLFISLTFFNLCGFAQGFVATYGFADVTATTGTLDPSMSPSVGGLTFGSFSAHGTSSNPSASGRFSFTGWPLGGVNGTDDYSNFTGALSPTVYYEVTIAADPGYTLSINTVTFSMRRSGTGIRNYCVRSDRDSYTNNLAASTGTNTKLSVIPGDVFFWNYDTVSTSSDQKGSAVSNINQLSAITGSVTFRFYGWNAESPGGSFAIDNVSFTGSVRDTTTVLNPAGLKPLPGEIAAIKVHPCPSTDGRIILESTGQLSRMEIMSLAGQTVFEQDLEGNKKTELNLSHLCNGIYFLKTRRGLISRIVLMRP